MKEHSSDRSQAEIDNRADQLNPNNDAYWRSRGEEERPEDWKNRLEQETRSEQ